MDEAAIERIYDAINDIIDGEDYETVMIALGALHNGLAVLQTKNEKHLRSLYTMLGDAAVCMAILDEEEARPTAGNVPGPSSIN